MFSHSIFEYRLVAIFLSVVFLTSCLTINSDLKINNDGSGTLSIAYTLDKTLNEISNFSDNNIIPLNLSEEYIQSIIGNRNDISYRNYRAYEDEEFYNIDVILISKILRH